LSENWPAIAVEVAAALGEVGFTATHRRTTISAGPNEWTPGGPVDVDTPVTILSDNFTFMEIDGTVIQTKDRKLLMEAKTVIPVPGDNLIIASVNHEILTVLPLDPGGIAVLYEVQARA
jgi:hypothetical protein